MLPIQQKQSKSYKDMPNLIALNGETYSKDFLFLAYVSDVRNNFQKYDGWETSFQEYLEIINGEWSQYYENFKGNNCRNVN